MVSFVAESFTTCFRSSIAWHLHARFAGEEMALDEEITVISKYQIAYSADLLRSRISPTPMSWGSRAAYARRG